MRATDSPENMKSTTDTKQDDAFFSKGYGAKLSSGAKEGLVFGVRVAAVVAPVLFVSYGLKALFSLRD